jgi:dephospho-CoA kinase
MDALAQLAEPAIRAHLAQAGIVGIDGLYSYSEYRTLRDAFGDKLVTVAVFTPKALRYRRLSEREDRPLTEGEATERDRAEIENIEKAGPIALADYTLLNGGTAEELAESCRTLLASLLSSGFRTAELQ